MTMQLTDDGTLDTVIRCSECGEEFRFNFANSGDDESPEGPEAYDSFVEDCCEDAAEEHECAPSDDDVETMLTSYIETALWSSNDESNEFGGNPLDENYDESDLSDAACEEMRKDCRDFLASNRADIGPHVESAGHNFWLNRNGHGAGFWDSSNFPGEIGQRLSAACKPYGSCDIYVGEDGKLHVQ